MATAFACGMARRAAAAEPTSSVLRCSTRSAMVVEPAFPLRRRRAALLALWERLWKFMIAHLSVDSPITANAVVSRQRSDQFTFAGLGKGNRLLLSLDI
jgi:hypothetical protein